MGARPDGFAGELDDGKAKSFGGAEVVAPLVVPHAEHGRVSSQEDGFTAFRFRGPDDALLQRAVLQAVQLDGVRDRSDCLPCFPHLGDGIVGEAADGHVDAALGSGAGGGQLPGRMGHGLQAGGGDAEREGDGKGRVEDAGFGTAV